MSQANTFGRHLTLSTFGESHGVALGALVEGCPAGVLWQQALLSQELERRRPGSSPLVSARAEGDVPELLSGVYEGKTLGTPIAVLIRNRDVRSADYQEIAANPRPGHADDLWRDKFAHSDPRGGGRSSGRETVARSIGGAIAKMVLRHLAADLHILGFARSIGPYTATLADVEKLLSQPGDYPADVHPARFPGSEPVEKLLLDAKIDGLSYGGVAEIRVRGLPLGVGQPVFQKLKAELAAAYMGVGATASFEVGAGLEATRAEGAKFHRGNSQDRYGGIRGGISSGETLVLRVGFKPTSSVLDVAKKGRHDPCIVPRALPVLEAMTALVLADHLLLQRLDQI